MKYTQQVNDEIANLENRGYEKSINPNTKQINMRKNCQLKLDKFLSLNEDGSIKWSTRQGSDVEFTLVNCYVVNNGVATDFDCKATLHKTSWEQNAVEIGKTYSGCITNTITERGTNALNPAHENGYFTLFSSVGTAASMSKLANLGL